MSQHPNSLAALRYIEPFRQELYRRIRTLVAAAPNGMTSDEVEAALGGRHQNISARTTEMRKLGLLLDSGRTRRTRGGRQAAVLVVDPARVEAPPIQDSLFP